MTVKVTAHRGPRCPKYTHAVAHYLFNLASLGAAPRSVLREQAAGFLRVRMWGINADEPHRNALAAGDLVLIYLGAPERTFIGRAELGSAAREWTPSEAQAYPGDSAVSSGSPLTSMRPRWRRLPHARPRLAELSALAVRPESLEEHSRRRRWRVGAVPYPRIDERQGVRRVGREVTPTSTQPSAYRTCNCGLSSAESWNHTGWVGPQSDGGNVPHVPGTKSPNTA